MHTPDSSRFWVADSYEERLAAGEEPESLDKEVVRRALADAGFTGDGDPPDLPEEVWTATSARYIDAYERLTGLTFEPGAAPIEERIGSFEPCERVVRHERDPSKSAECASSASPRRTARGSPS